VASPGGEPPTVLDPGRRQPYEAELTELDPGRSRPPRGAGPTLEEGLAPRLDARFTIVRVLSRAGDEARTDGRTQVGAEADVYLVQERATGDLRALKLYHQESVRDPRVREFLERKESRYTVDVTECATEQGRGYEIMEHLGGGTLTELREQFPASLDAEALTVIVRQLAQALAEMHAADVVHRDVKPANVMLRSRAPFEVALIDFGISTYAPLTAPVSDRSGSVRYMPPEFISGQILSPAYDWWSLGATIRELATGQRLLEGLDEHELRAHVATGPVSVAQIADDRIRLLCQGLLVPHVDDRWGAAQVEEWLAGGSPPVSVAYPARAGSTDALADEPYVYLDTSYLSRIDLAAAMAASWETAVALLHGTDRAPLEQLEEWLRQFPGTHGEPPREAGAPADILLLRLLRWMAPGLPPIYRGVNISLATLPTIARDAAGGVGMFPELVEQLWAHRLLPVLAAGSPEAGLDGGAGLDTADEDWRARRPRYERAAEAVADPAARAVLDQHDRGTRQRDLAYCLWAAVADADAVAQVRLDLLAQARQARYPWFSALVRDEHGMWVALRLGVRVREWTEERDELERAEARHRIWLSRNERHREWSRRQNRPLALSWAVAGVFLMGVVCALLISVSDITGHVSVDSVLDAWVATVFTLLSTLTVESLLAWEIGGRFHPRYSMLGAGFIALGRAARSVAGRGIALGVVLGVLGGAYLLTVFLPVATPLAAGGGVLVWAVLRYLGWCADRDRERADAERGARELRAAAAARGR
jgi:tRNA A-37 threonylcarbamoyl transferase component Bud32